MLKKLFILLSIFTVAFGIEESFNFYNINYNDNQKLINVINEVTYVNILDKFNNEYYINSEFLVDNGIIPFSTFYMIDENKEYSVELNVISSYEIQGVDIELDNQVLNNNILSEKLNMRGVNMHQIIFYPIQYNSATNTLTIIEEFDISIIEIDNFENNQENHIVPISNEFEKIISSMVINLDISDRTTDSQPSILYICGGSSLSNSYLQDLIQWRKEQGYKVYTASTSDIGTSFNSIDNYISDAYYQWEFPPEYVVLVGDTGGSYQVPSTSASGGDSDYPYTLIQGGDLLPEMFIGRISANSSSDLNNIINKTLAYEKASFIDYTGSNWYESSALVGDPSSSGNSAIITNEYIENILQAYDFEDVEACYGCGSYSSWMQNKLEEGILYFNYRGYIGTSGFGSSHINNANNGYMTPFVTFITCATGGFGGTAITESFIRAGSVSNPKGGVAAIGTATSSTHTVPNKIVDMGIYDGIFAKGVSTAGGALVSGKMALHSTYPQDPYSMTYKFTHWNNLMGDPVLNLWTDSPKILNVEYSDMINMGTDFLEFSILDAQTNPVSDARVVVYIDDDNIYESFTNSDGHASIQFSNLIPSSASITVLKKNFIPFIGSVAVFNEDMHIQVNNELLYIDDANSENNGPSNGLADAGEIVDIYLYLENLSSNSISLLDGYVSTNSEKIDIIDGNIEIDYLTPLVPTIIGPVQAYIHEDLISTDNTDLILTLIDESDGLSDWNFNVPFDIMSPNITVQYSQYNNSPNPGATVELNMTLENIGDQELENSHISISTANSLIDFTQSESFIGNILPGQVGTNLEPIIIEFSDNIIDGSIVNLNINIHNDDGFSQDINLNVTVGIADEHDPLGPDSYGYYIYDSTDIGYSLTPFYDWIEIDPNQGGDGIDLGISHSGNGNGSVANSTKYIDLPFIFTFYGEQYNEVSVSANGWISFGHSNMESFRNYQLPGAGGPSPMVAAFWDDLKTNGNSKVLKYVTEDYVIIEWLNMLTYQHSDIQTFQIILYNSITPTGDDEIKIQYKEFNNTTNGDYSQYTPYHGCYSTIGIENHLSDTGLEYTFDNNYPVAAAPLEDQSALFITTRNTTVLTAGDVNQDEEINILDIVMVINHILMVEILDSIGQFVADIDGNQSINILDVILIINLIFES